MNELFVFYWIALATIYILKPKNRTQAWMDATIVAAIVFIVAIVFDFLFIQSEMSDLLWLLVCGIILGFTLLYYLELKADGKMGFPWFIIGVIALILLIGVAQRHLNTKVLESIQSDSSIERP